MAPSTCGSAHRPPRSKRPPIAPSPSRAFFEKEHGRYWGNVVQGFGEIGYRFATSRYVIEPVIDAAVVHIHQDGFRESGGAAALIGYAQDTDTASTTLGVRAEAAPINGLPLIARTFLGWRHGYGNINPSATFAFASGSTPFSSSGAPDRPRCAGSRSRPRLARLVASDARRLLCGSDRRPGHGQRSAGAGGV